MCGYEISSLGVSGRLRNDLYGAECHISTRIIQISNEKKSDRAIKTVGMFLQSIENFACTIQKFVIVLYGRSLVGTRLFLLL